MSSIKRHPGELTSLLRLLVAAVLVLATLLRFWKLENTSFGFDAAALSSLAARFVATGAPPVLGMVSSVGIRNPPLAVYLITLPVLLDQNPVTVLGFVALVNVIGVLGCYWLTQRYWGSWEAVLAALLLACSPWAVHYSRGVLAQDLLLPGVILFIAFLLRWLLDARPWALSGAIITAALLVQIHLAALALLPILIVVLLAYRPARPETVGRSRFWIAAGAGLAVSVALYLPYVLALGPDGAQAARETAGAAAGSGAPAGWKPVLFALMNVGGLNIHALAGPEHFQRFLASLLPLNYGPDRIEAALVVLGALYLAVRCWRQRADYFTVARDRVLLLWLALPVLFFELWPTEVYPHYLLPIYPAPYIIFAVAGLDFGRRVLRGRAEAESSEARAPQRRPASKALALAAALALVALVAWQTSLTLKLYELADAVDRPVGVSISARALRDVGLVIDEYVAEHPNTKVVALCPGEEPRWADPRWDDCPAALDFVAGQKHDMSYVNYDLPAPSIPETDVDLLVVVAPGGDAAASQLSTYAEPLPEKAVSAGPGAGVYQFFVVYNHLRDVRESVEAVATSGDAILFSSPGRIEAFRPFYGGSTPVLELPSAEENAASVIAKLEEAASEYSRLFVVYQGAENGDPGGAIDAWLSEYGFKAFDMWLGDLRFALYATPRSDERGAEEAIGADLGGQLRLVASEIAPQSLPIAPGDVLRVQLQWRVLQKVEADYSAFLQLVDANGKPVAGSDNLLTAGGKPTSQWDVDSTVATRRALLAPPGVAPGRYRLVTGLYRADQPGYPRLPTPEGDYVSLAEIEVR